MSRRAVICRERAVLGWTRAWTFDSVDFDILRTLVGVDEDAWQDEAVLCGDGVWRQRRDQSDGESVFTDPPESLPRTRPRGWWRRG